MARSRLFDGVRRAFQVSEVCASKKLSTRSALELRAEREHEAKQRLSRRAFVGGVAAGAGALFANIPSARAIGKFGPKAKIAILGGGFAGLAAADMLRAHGVSATIYEANATRLGGRVYSSHDFPGQVAENGGELIDTLHKTVLGYASQFGLEREDLGKEPGEIAYHFFGQTYSEEAVVDEMRILVERMRPDLQMLSGAPTFYQHNMADVLLDQTSLWDYLEARAYDLPLAFQVMNQAYIAEYGRELSEQSCLNMLLFYHLDRRSKFAPYGCSDERFHLVGGNDQIAAGIAARLPGPIVLGARVTRIRRNASGQYALTFSGSSTEELADALVVALPFSVLRTIDLDPSLGLSLDKRRAITELAYGYNAKTMIGFDSRPWADFYDNNGAVYSDLPNVQNIWETNWTRAIGGAVLTDYSGGERGRQLQQPVIYPPDGGAPLTGCSNCHIGSPSARVVDDTVIQQQVDAFVTDFDAIFPGVKAAATRVNGKYHVRRMHWLPQNTSRGSYTCYTPGQFTSLGGLEGEAAGLMKFAGEHADSFYNWQGYMEGALSSGLRAASELLADMKAGVL
jgi:monoamine oxidase